MNWAICETSSNGDWLTINSPDACQSVSALWMILTSPVLAYRSATFSKLSLLTGSSPLSPTCQ